MKGNGGTQASAADLLRFYRRLLSQPEAVRNIVLTAHADGANPDGKKGYGLFFRLDEVPLWVQAVHAFGYLVGGVLGHVVGALMSAPYCFVAKYWLKPQLLGARPATCEGQ